MKNEKVGIKFINNPLYCLLSYITFKSKVFQSLNFIVNFIGFLEHSRKIKIHKSIRKYPKFLQNSRK